MNAKDDRVRRLVSAALTIADIDVRNLTIEVADSHLSVRGSVPTLGQKARLIGVLREQLDNSLSLDCDVVVRDVEPSSRDGEGRSALTGT
jgi:hypothetical protein